MQPGRGKIWVLDIKSKVGGWEKLTLPSGVQNVLPGTMSIGRERVRTYVGMRQVNFFSLWYEKKMKKCEIFSMLCENHTIFAPWRKNLSTKQNIRENQKFYFVNLLQNQDFLILTKAFISQKVVMNVRKIFTQN